MKTKIIIFNKPGRFLENKLYFKEECLENVRQYHYLGVHFSSSGVFNFAQDNIFKKSIKTSFKLTNLITTGGEPSINANLHLYDHLLKPLVLYGSEIRVIFKTNSAASENSNGFIFDRNL